MVLATHQCECRKDENRCEADEGSAGSVSVGRVGCDGGNVERHCDEDQARERCGTGSNRLEELPPLIWTEGIGRPNWHHVYSWWSEGVLGSCSARYCLTVALSAVPSEKRRSNSTRSQLSGN